MPARLVIIGSGPAGWTAASSWPATNSSSSADGPAPDPSLITGDFIYGGDGSDLVFGGGGNDRIETGPAAPSTFNRAYGGVDRVADDVGVAVDVTALIFDGEHGFSPLRMRL